MSATRLNSPSKERKLALENELLDRDKRQYTHIKKRHRNEVKILNTHTSGMTLFSKKDTHEVIDMYFPDSLNAGRDFNESGSDSQNEVIGPIDQVMDDKMPEEIELKLHRIQK